MTKNPGLIIFPLVLTLCALMTGLIAATLYGDLRTSNVGGTMALLCFFVFVTLCSFLATAICVEG